MSVVFINTLYYPDPEEQKRLDWLQEQFDLYQAEMDYQSRDFTPFQKKIYKEASHRNVRAQISIVLQKD